MSVPVPGKADLLTLAPGLTCVTGDEGAGKTSLLRSLGGDSVWLELSLPGRDDETPAQVWATLRLQFPLWSEALNQDLAEALGLQPHLDKKLYMLSTGSRRKVALAGLLAAGATITCLDQPFDALDAASVKVIREFLADAADHPSRSWVVADYEADARLPWRRQIKLT
ncbi:MAG: hypothetical protein V4684_14670 [Pseudomonadota bacterium]